jgi:quinol monooxygenase YgiN
MSPRVGLGPLAVFAHAAASGLRQAKERASMIIVVGSVDGRSETFDNLVKISLDHVHRSRGEDGCIEHTVQIDCEDPLRLRFFERWRDAAALKAHFARSESRAFVQDVARLSAEPPVMAIYEAEEKRL